MTQTPDVLIVGGGVIGLAIALELRARGATITVLTRDHHEAATRAAGGMLAPHAELLPPGALLDLGLKSLSLYPDWVQRIEALSGCKTGYWPSGILSPVYRRDGRETAVSNGAYSLQDSERSPQPTGAEWIDAANIHHVQPGLSQDLAGGWWHPDDGQVDNRQLMHALWTAAEREGITLYEGVTVEAIRHSQGRVTGVWTDAGTYEAEHYVLATGAWASDLVPIPVTPIKGQMLSVRMPGDRVNGCQQPIKRVLFGEDIYIVPRQDGRILLGATVESVGFAPHNTPGGLQTLLNAAIRLYPAIAHARIEECWWGFRPSTPDEAPILGASHCHNLTLATGHHRNGILLAPATALLTADWIWSQTSNDLLLAFSWQRFASSTPAVSTSASTPSVPTRPTFTQPVDYTDTTQSQNHSMHILDSPSTQSTTAQAPSRSNQWQDTPLVIAGRTFHSRLMTGTGKYRNFDQMNQAIAASECEIVTVAVRRVQTQAPGHEGLAEALDWSTLWMLPNTAGCKTAEEAIRVARLGREMAKLLGQEDNNFVKLEVIPDATYLLPDPIGTLEAAEQLVKEGFAVLPYINADPLLAKRLEEVGCATVMPLGSPIGSGQGIRNAANIQIIIENANVPVVVDAGIGTPSEAAQAMEMGADALLINTAIAQAADPGRMGRAMNLATQAGRLAFIAGRIPVKALASPSSPVIGTVGS